MCGLSFAHSSSLQRSCWTILSNRIYAVPKLSHPRCIDTALIFHHPRGRPLKPGLAWLTRKWLGRTILDRGPGDHNPEEDARACMDLLKAKIKNGASLDSAATEFD